MESRTANPMHYETNAEEEKKKYSNKTYIFGVIGLVCLFLFGLTSGMLIEKSGSSSSAESETNNPTSIPPIPPQQSPPSVDELPRTVFVHLFSWKWTDIEKECVNFLGPNGFSAVQVSPVNEHMEHTLIKDIVDVGDWNPWWARYQPVSYKIESRSGSREEFISMVQTCKSVGVGVYVDAVLNHMAAMNVKVGNFGSYFDSDVLDYPGIFNATHFNDCDPQEIQGIDYSTDSDRVRRCRLVGLPDLKQELPYVREKMREFLQDLVDIGVEGFRLDVAKHMYPEDLDAIFKTVVGDYYVFGEVPSYGGEVIQFEEYTPYFDVTEFRYKAALQDIFTDDGRRLAELVDILSTTPLVSTTEAVVFVDNHDTQRSTYDTLIYRAGPIYELANVFLLAFPYGYPKLMSSYDFAAGEFDRGPPEYENGDTKEVYNADGSMNCEGDEWICEHRRTPMKNMVGFKNYAHSKDAYEISNWWTNDFQAVAFSRTGPNGVVGFVIINKEDFSLGDKFYYTGLPDGVYCDVADGDFAVTGCSGRSVVVQDGGYIRVEVEALKALAIHGGAKL